jgi:hypothetical protein
MDKLSPKLSKAEYEALPAGLQEAYCQDGDGSSYRLDLAPHGSSAGECGIAAAKRRRVADACRDQVLTDLLQKHKLDRNKHFQTVASRTKIGVNESGEVIVDAYLPGGQVRMLAFNDQSKLYGDGDSLCRELSVYEESKQLAAEREKAKPTIVQFQRPDDVVEEKVVDGVKCQIHANGSATVGSVKLSEMSSAARMSWCRRLGLQRAAEVAKSRTLTEQETDALATLSPHERLRRYRLSQGQQP